MTWIYWCITIYLIIGIILSALTCHMLSDQSIYDDFKNEVDKEQLEDVVYSKADNIRNDVPKKMSYLNKKAQVKYQDMQIDADYIQIDWDKGMIYARGKVDSTGKIVIPASATQGGKKYEYRDFNYNYKTKQAIAYDARTEESEGVVVAQ